MPLVLKNGKWVSVGEGGDTTAYAPEQPPAPPKPKPKPKPWWEKVVNDLRYEAKQLQANPIQRLNTYSANLERGAIAEAPSPNPLVKGLGTLMKSENPLNDLQYEVTQLSNPERVNPRLVNLFSTAFLGKTLGETAFLGNTQALANIARNAGDAGPGDYTDRGEAFDPDRFADESYRSGGFTPPSEMTDEQKAGDDARASLMLNLGIGSIGGVLAPAAAQLPYLGPLITRAQAALNPANARTALGAATRVAAALGLEETLSTPLDDNTGGSAMSLLSPELDPVKPGMTRNEASAAAFLPNLAASVTMVGAVGGLPRLFKAMPSTRRAKQAEAQRATRQTERAEQVQSGLVQEDDTGRAAFTEEALQAPAAKVPEAVVPAPDAAAAEAQLRGDLGVDGGVEDFAGTPQGELTVSKVDPKEDPWEIEYDPSTPESDGLGEVLNEASDQELIEIAQADRDIPTVTDEVLSRPGEGYDPEARISNASASTDALAESPDGYAARLGQVSTDRLRSMAHPQNGTVLHDAIAAQTGKDWEQYTRADVIRGLEQLESEGVAVMANRLMGAPMMDVNDIQVAPNRFQFKDNVDAQGQQKGNSLEGVERWNTDMEGTVQVWEDPQDGKTYVVNGHNRLAKARALGIPSIRVEYLTAPTDLGARAQGALNNIADGSGTAFDAAKFFRESGVTSAEDLAKTGVPMKSGLAVQGLALSKLPDNLFQKAVNGELSMGRALALGGSDLSPEDMIRVNQMAAGHDMTDRAFSEMVQMAGTAPQVASDQVGLFGAEMMDTIAIKADLAAKLRAELTSNRNLFKRVTRNKAAQALETKAGTRVDQGTATSAAETAQAVLGQFDADKYMEGTAISQLLNDGTAEIANGAKAQVVMKRILRQLEAAAEAAPPAPKVVDEAPVEAAPAEPAPLNPAERRALKMQILSKAAQNGEVRPPSTPLLETPRTTDVPLKTVAEAVDRGEVTPEVLRALDDEVRLQAEFAEFDAKVEAEVIKAEREAIGYDNLTFEEKKATGMLDGWDGPDPVTLDERAAYAKQKRIAAEQAGDTALAREWREAERKLERSRVSRTVDQQNANQQDMFGVGQYDTDTPLLNPEVVPDVPIREMPKLADRFAELMDQMVESDRRMFKTVDGILGTAKQAVDMLGEVIEIPAAASRRITNATSEARVMGAAQSLYNWANSGVPGSRQLIKSVDEALELVRAKKAILDPDKIPGLAMDTARSDRAMGRSSADTDAVGQAYRQFYGVNKAEPSGVKRPLSAQLRGQLQTLGESLGEHTRSLDQHFKTQEGFLEARRVDLEAQSQALQFQLPKDLSKSSPRFGMATLKFESDLDRAAYMLRDASKKSKGEDRLIAALEAEGFDIKEIRRLGQEVKARIQDGIQEATGSRRAPQQSMEIEVPASRVEADGAPARLALPDSAQLEANNLAIQSKEAEIAALKAQAQQGGC